MFCNNCGHQTDDNSAFCRFCGGQIKGAQQPDAPMQTYQDTSLSDYVCDEKPSQSKTFLMVTLILWLVSVSISFIWNRIVYNFIVPDFFKFNDFYITISKILSYVNLILAAAIFVFSLLAFIFEMKKKTGLRILCIIAFVTGCILFLNNILSLINL